MKGKTYKIELTKGAIILWSIIFMIIVVWSFVLGLLIGSGFFSEKEALSSASDLKKEQQREEILPKSPPKFSFHQVLTSTRPTASAVEEKSSVSKDNRCYTVQVAAFVREKDAKNLVRRLSSYNAYYVKTFRNGKIYYRVRCGRFKDKKMAESLRKTIFKTSNIKGIIVKCQ